MAFHCQKCKAPIALDDTLKNLSKVQLNLLLSKSGRANSNTKLSPTQYIPKDRLDRYNDVLKQNPGATQITKIELDDPTSCNSTHSYVYVSDAEDDDDNKDENDQTEDVPKQTDEQLPDFSRIKSLHQVFDILSTNEDVSHPMCVECSHLLTENYKLKFDQSQREKEYYLTFLKKLKERENDARADDTDSKISETANELQQLQDLEQAKLKELEDLESTFDDLNIQLDDLNNQLTHLNRNELNDIMQLKNALNLELQLKQNRLDQAKALYQKHLNHLDELRTLNIYAKLFEILFDKKDSCGRINGFRIGYKVPWPEINVALGQVVLLLVFLMKRLDLTLDSYKLVPMGSKSYIVKHATRALEESDPRTRTNSVLQLYSSNEFTLGKLFNFNKMDVSMIALLEILSQFETKLASLDEELELPYKISARHDSIGGKSIRVTSNGQWTEACRYLLINLNWILTYASAHTSE